MNDELLVNEQLKTFVDAIQSLKELDNDMLDEETLDLMTRALEVNFSPEIMKQSVQEIINNLEAQGQSRADVLKVIKSLKDFMNEQIYGDGDIVGNKKIITDLVLGKVYSIFDEATEKYHNYAIELPMTIDEGAKVPTYAHDTDAAADLYAMEDTTLAPHSYGNKIRTGVKIQLPESWLALIIPRSSIGAKTPLRLSNSVGLIDSGYRGELGVLYDNVSDESWDIHAGDRIAQLLVMPSYRFKAQVVDTLEDSDRGEGGFGSSGA